MVNCNGCTYKDISKNDGDHCYMFSRKPAVFCGQDSKLDSQRSNMSEEEFIEAMSGFIPNLGEE